MADRRAARYAGSNAPSAILITSMLSSSPPSCRPGCRSPSSRSHRRPSAPPSRTACTTGADWLGRPDRLEPGREAAVARTARSGLGTVAGGWLPSAPGAGGSARRWACSPFGLITPSSGDSTALGVADPGAQPGGGTLVRVLATSGAVLGAIIVSSAPGPAYFRQPGLPQIWLATQPIPCRPRSRRLDGSPPSNSRSRRRGRRADAASPGGA